MTRARAPRALHDDNGSSRPTPHPPNEASSMRPARPHNLTPPPEARA
jgi:hypothetical protein